MSSRASKGIRLGCAFTSWADHEQDFPTLASITWYLIFLCQFVSNLAPQTSTFSLLLSPQLSTTKKSHQRVAWTAHKVHLPPFEPRPSFFGVHQLAVRCASLVLFEHLQAPTESDSHARHCHRRQVRSKGYLWRLLLRLSTSHGNLWRFWVRFVMQSIGYTQRIVPGAIVLCGRMQPLMWLFWRWLSPLQLEWPQVPFLYSRSAIFSGLQDCNSVDFTYHLSMEADAGDPKIHSSVFCFNEHTVQLTLGQSSCLPTIESLNLLVYTDAALQDRKCNSPLILVQNVTVVWTYRICYSFRVLFTTPSPSTRIHGPPRMTLSERPASWTYFRTESSSAPGCSHRAGTLRFLAFSRTLRVTCWWAVISGK